MNKASLLNEQEKQAVIKKVREFLKREDIDQKAFAVRLGKTETTVSRLLSGKYPITRNNADAIDFIIGMAPRSKSSMQNAESPSSDIDIAFLKFKAGILNYIMKHPAICDECKKQVYKAIQEFQPA